MPIREYKINEASWEPTCERYVAFIDIMGFKDMVARGHENVYALMKKLSRHTKFNTTIAADSRSEFLLKITKFSDSIMVFTKDNSIESLEQFITYLSSLQSDLYNSSIPFKGASACGKMTIDFKEEIFLGQPLIDAYLFQEELLLYGIVLHATMEEKITSFEPQGYEEVLTDVLCPFKGATAWHILITPLDLQPHDSKDKSAHRKMIDGIMKLKFKTSGSLRKYIDNTTKYLFDASKDYGKFKKNREEK